MGAACNSKEILIRTTIMPHMPTQTEVLVAAGQNYPTGKA